MKVRFQIQAGKDAGTTFIDGATIQYEHEHPRVEILDNPLVVAGILAERLRKVIAAFVPSKATEEMMLELTESKITADGSKAPGTIVDEEAGKGGTP